MILVLLYAVCAVLLAIRGAQCGGWAEELGRIYYCYAIFVGSVAVERVGREWGKAVAK